MGASMDTAAVRPPAASLIVIDSGGQRTRVEIQPLPFTIGRQADNQLILRDSRASRIHSHITTEGSDFVIEDCGSRHGTHVNGHAVKRHVLCNSDRIEFGVADSYQLIFAIDGAGLKHAMEHLGAHDKSTTHPGVGGNLAKLRAILDLARTLQSSFSTDDVLKSVVDTALTITGAERGFLLLRAGESLEIKAARNRHGVTLSAEELHVPRSLIRRALERRRDLFSMNFDPHGESGEVPQQSIADMELRSVTCVPLVRIRTGQAEVTSLLTTGSETVGALYMDSRLGTADLAGGNRELLQTLAIEASTILENARLLEEERVKLKMDEELNLARTIQQSLLPRKLSVGGWFQACGSSLATYQVGGDYYDFAMVNEHCWSVVMADVSGKGVSSALLAGLLQGALITATAHPAALAARTSRLNAFLNDRTGGEKYATIFYCLMESTGLLHYVNAAHCPPLVVREAGGLTTLETTGMPVGLLEGAEYTVATEQLQAGDKVIVYSDGVTEAQSASGEFFGKKRLREVALAYAGLSCQAMHDSLQRAVTAFTAGAPQSDDITLLVLEYRPEAGG